MSQIARQSPEGMAAAEAREFMKNVGPTVEEMAKEAEDYVDPIKVARDSAQKRLVMMSGIN